MTTNLATDFMEALVRAAHAMLVPVDADLGDMGVETPAEYFKVLHTKGFQLCTYHRRR